MSQLSILAWNDGNMFLLGNRSIWREAKLNVTRLGIKNT
ncbi:hypothetical protein C3B79_1668 [Aeromonas hydrophila]|nr:hypothetical protein C3B79_1668 [Aeromonas hydrophila]